MNNNHNHNGYDDDSGSDHKGNNGSLASNILDLRINHNNNNDHHLNSNQQTEMIISSSPSIKYMAADTLSAAAATAANAVVNPDTIMMMMKSQFDQNESKLSSIDHHHHQLDLYKHYYYYLMQQQQQQHEQEQSTFASRVVAETYAKLLSSTTKTITSPNGNDHLDRSKTKSPPIGFDTKNQQSFNGKSLSSSSSFENNGLYETKRTSPDCSQDGLIIINGGNGGITELRSADTTNGTIFDRKRISRPLTGKHVRHGTGASPTTLLTLKNMIQQRQKLKEINQFNFGNNNIRYGKSSSTSKTNKRIKRK